MMHYDVLTCLMSTTEWNGSCSPGTPAARRAVQPPRCSLPTLQVTLSPNHSSVFRTITASVRRAHTGGGFEGAHFQPRPPVSSKTNAATAVHLRMS